jgi:dimethylaniline monooxygenase (N-oxide forming)
MFLSWGIGAVSRAARAIAKPLVWANWRALESLLKLQLKLKKCGMVPEERIEDRVNCSVPIATPDFSPMVVDGRIKAVRGTFDHYDGKAIVMTGGERVVADVAILAIGFKLGVPFLPEAYRDKLVEPDGQYRLYRVIANPDLPDMGFVGFNSSFCTVLSAEMAANWLVRYCDGQLANQPTGAEMQKNMDMMLHFRRVERPAAGVYGGLCTAPYHFKHFDELLADMGATIRRRSPLAEKFTPPDADAYARFLASAPDYKLEPV